MESITEAIIRYQKSGSGYNEITKRISLIIYSYPLRNNYLTEEDQCEFYLSFYNRIEGLIKNFTFKGIPFEVLLNKTLKWHTKTYMNCRKKEKQLIAVNNNEAEIKIKDILYNDEDKLNDYDHLPDITLKGKASRKRLLILVLVNSHIINDKEMKTFSQITGYNLEWLLDLKDILNSRLFERSKRLNRLREKRNNTYFNLLYKQSFLSDELDIEKKVALIKQIDRLKKRLNDTREEISKVPCCPTHSEIADLLNIPKGTVDSGIHYFRKKHKALIEDNGYSLFF